ncbi:MAG: type II toxin-antitoxin system HipA family toxin [Treponemataceae bacterium]|nr:type II toxin-antitoxin system HipA family toxin [Treponemataceae bacterium]
MISATVKLWNVPVGAVVQGDDGSIRFNYYDDFLSRGVSLSPLMMPLSRRVYEFSDLYDSPTFRGLPGLLADSMPDRFGNQIIRKYLTERGIKDEEFTAVERLLYTGKRGMGALEYEPVSEFAAEYTDSINLQKLIQCAADILNDREEFHLNSDESAMTQILSVGTSAGGARAKAVIAWNRMTGDIRSGQVSPEPGYEHWLIKFDGVENNKDDGDLIPDPKCLTRIEYAYYLMATDCGIIMSPCTCLEEDGMYHFMTKRFDRTDDGKKLHMQTLGAMAHLDLKHNAGTNSYEEAAFVIRQLELGQNTLDQFFRRAVFNICAKNHDDHVKNTSFLMDRQGNWSLSPAYDLTYAYKPGSKYTSTHHLSLNNKVDGFFLQDLIDFARKLDISERKAKSIIEQVQGSVSNWKTFADKGQVPEQLADEIMDKQILFKL